MKSKQQTSKQTKLKQIGDCQRQGVGGEGVGLGGEMGEGGQNLQTFSYNISHGDIIYHMTK